MANGHPTRRGDRDDRDDRRGGADWGWAKRLIEYALVVLVAIIVSWLIIYFVIRPNETCADCYETAEQYSGECDRQFNGPNSTQLDAMWEQEELIAFVQPSDDQGGQSDGFSGATSSSTAPITRGPGFVLVRVQPEIDFSGQSTGGPDVNSLPQGKPWELVTVTVARYIDHLRSEKVCEGMVRLRDGKFEFFCNRLTTRFGSEDFGQISYRVYVRNASSVPISYCFVSNCTDSAPWGVGRLCRREQEQIAQY
jgi:hypothetical protein